MENNEHVINENGVLWVSGVTMGVGERVIVEKYEVKVGFFFFRII